MALHIAGLACSIRLDRIINRRYCCLQRFLLLFTGALEMTAADLVGRWHIRCRRFQLAHYKSSRRFMFLHYLLGVIATLLATIVATSVFSDLSKETATALSTYVPVYVIRAISITGAVLTALHTFLRYADRAEKHRMAAAAFSNLKDRLELLVVFPPATDSGWKAALSEIENAWQKLRAAGPIVPSTIWRFAESRVEFN